MSDDGPRRVRPDTMVDRLRSALAASLEVGQLPPADHRPWPLPAGPWIMAQTWPTLLFAHWPVPVPSMRALSYAARDSLDWWLTERYCLYAIDRRGRVYRAEIHHAPWPLQPADAFIARNTMADPLGLSLDGRPLLHFARRLDVRVWPLAPARGRSVTRIMPAA
jgi:uncharacterized protein YqjF (DUF2071 family)